MNNSIWHTHKITGLDRAKLNNQKPFVLWITGLSASGKSTLASEIESYLYGIGHHCYLLDGDNVRHGLNKDLGFDEQSRIENIRRIGEVSKLMLDAGIIVITAFISPFRTDRYIVRNMHNKNEFIELYLDVPLEVCERRDPKGLYKKARRGEITQFTGIDSPYEIPLNPEITVKGGELGVKQELHQVIEYLKKHDFIN
jgi:adenylylsulfate kinase